MEKNSVIGYVLIFFLFIGFYFFSKQNQEELTNQKVNTEDTVETKSATADNAQISYSDSQTLAVDSNLTEMITTLRNDLLEIDFSNIGGIPKKVTLAKYKRYDSSALVLFDNGQTKLGYTIPLANGTSINTLNTSFEAQIIGDSQVVMTANLLNNARIIQCHPIRIRLIIKSILRV
jgi:YidC/Oxa1 family membrane protein insertase